MPDDMNVTTGVPTQQSDEAKRVIAGMTAELAGPDKPKPTVAEAAAAHRAKLEAETGDRAARAVALAAWAQVAVGEVALPVHRRPPWYKRIWLGLLAARDPDPRDYPVVEVFPTVTAHPCFVRVKWDLASQDYSECAPTGINYGFSLRLSVDSSTAENEFRLQREIADHLRNMLACFC